MPDYGHPLRFGTFVTPSNAPPEHPVGLAILSEELGFDLVTFQDHPYQPAFLDTWTLLTWVAAHTHRVELAGNVLNLPLRQPAVLARSVASLDLLTGGRVALGLGAGAFWDAIEAMGAPRLTPGESVDALTEAIEVIRGVWDTDGRGPLRAGGRHHHVDGAKRGPAPAHEVPIWLGALKPRMLRLVGRSAQGWLPSLGRLQPGDLGRGNATIDAAAVAAGRDPREVTRLLNIGPQVGVDEVVRLAVEDGVSVFVVASDDPGELETVARDVVPVVQQRVGEARRSAERPVT
ncbi:N5,N10-methylene tetrahydromethanopterin reductase [Cellulomonas chitinilytica]|uniref:N5,N10-methylene tetrahydromethanopterin reductase n=1 Tax=Cellulomonas chitinilytica TaxID=398759 RepID=A0A919TZU0_9CELL|nr:LLM class flavin-dependent oxidoreductase [Cellulomonas chitinilytica]GIG22130.1 N5,N10-methylene tetrahydromethanopterin reductase [Cellulomonas chitinilytica]